MITVQTLTEAGYRCHPGIRGDTLYQKAILDGSTKLYFINFQLWHHPGGKVVFDTNVRLYTDNEAVEFDLNLISTDRLTVQQVEEFYAFVYQKLSLVPDRHNND